MRPSRRMAKFGRAGYSRPPRRGYAVFWPPGALLAYGILPQIRLCACRGRRRSGCYHKAQAAGLGCIIPGVPVWECALGAGASFYGLEAFLCAFRGISPECANSVTRVVRPNRPASGIWRFPGCRGYTSSAPHSPVACAMRPVGVTDALCGRRRPGESPYVWKPIYRCTNFRLSGPAGRIPHFDRAGGVGGARSD